MPTKPPFKPSPASPAERTYRAAFLALLTLFLLLCVHLANVRSSLLLRPAAAAAARPHLATRARMREITADNTDLTYFPHPDVLLMTMAKGGTTSTFNWLYYGLAGRKFNKSACDTYVQDVRSPCWLDHARNLYHMPDDDQWRILTGPDTLRVAIQRNPFERLVSSWKSKVTCEADVYGTDVRNRDAIVPQLLRQAGFVDDHRNCLNISEFALVLDRVRARVGIKLQSLRKLDVHLRPQEFYFDDIDYDIVLDVNELGNVTNVEPILKRLPQNEHDFVKAGPPTMHSSKGDDLMIPESAAKLLHLFAMESKWGKLKKMP